MLPIRIATFCGWQFNYLTQTVRQEEKIRKSYFTQRQMTESSVRGQTLWAKEKLVNRGLVDGTFDIYVSILISWRPRSSKGQETLGRVISNTMYHAHNEIFCSRHPFPWPLPCCKETGTHFRGAPLKKLFCAAEKNSISAFLSTSAPSPGLLSTCSHDQKYRVHIDDLKEAAESPGHSNVASFVSLLKKYNRFAERLWAYVQGSWIRLIK